MLTKSIIQAKINQNRRQQSARKREPIVPLGNLWDFVPRGWAALYPKTELETNWHHQLIAEWLQYIFEKNDGTSLILNEPPRHLKSIIASIIFPSYVWAREPGNNFLSISYNEKLANKHNRFRRELICSELLQQYQKIKLSKDLNQIGAFKNQYNAGMISCGLSGVTGDGGEYIVLDDPNDPYRVESKVQRDAVNDIVNEYSVTRRNNLKKGSTIVIQQRTHAEDCTWKLRQLFPDAINVILPLIATENERWVFPLSGRVVTRKSGDLLHPERMGEREVEQAQRLGTYLFNCRYQQAPADTSGTVFNPNWWRYYDTIPDTESPSYCIWVWDTAFKTKQENDYSVGIKIARMVSGKIYVIDLIRDKWQYPELKEKIASVCSDYTDVYIEDAASGVSVIQDLKQSFSNVIAIPRPDRDKFARATAVIPLIEAGKVYLPQDAHWKADFLEELKAFNQNGNYSHDDQVDALAHALEILKVGTFWDEL